MIWSKEDKARLAELLHESPLLTFSEIGKRLGISKGSAVSAAHRHLPDDAKKRFVRKKPAKKPPLSLNKTPVAVWLVDNTSLTFDQIADFCDLSLRKVKSIADGEVIVQGLDPVASGQITAVDIERCQNDPEEWVVKPTQSSQQLTSLIPAAGRCAYPFGHPDKPDFHFCQELAVLGPEGLVWCGSHRKIVYTKLRVEMIERLKS